MAVEQPASTTAEAMRCCHEMVTVATSESLQFVDITEAVAACCEGSAVSHGVVTVVSRHTTAAVLIQENEPLLLGDLCRMLQAVAPRHRHYCHNDIDARHDVPPDERPNGHSHAQALLLPSSLQVVLVDGRLDLGRWQRLFLVELDGPRERAVSVMILGVSTAAGSSLRLVRGSTGGGVS